MTDQHQVHSIIATAICDALKKDPDHRMDAEEAKQIAKCIVEALTDAGLQIAPLGKIMSECSQTARSIQFIFKHPGSFQRLMPSKLAVIPRWNSDQSKPSASPT